MDYITKLSTLLNLDHKTLQEIYETKSNINNLKTQNQNEIYKLSYEILKQTNLNSFAARQLFLSNITHFHNPSYMHELAKSYSQSFGFDYPFACSLAIKTPEPPNAPSSYTKSIEKVFKKYFDYSSKQTRLVIGSYPMLACTPVSLFVFNYEYMTKDLGISPETVRIIFNACPLIFACNYLAEKLDLFKIILNLSASELNNFLLHHHKLLFLSSQKMSNILEYLTKQFYYTDSQLLTLIRAYPQILELDKNTIYSNSRCLMRTFSLSEQQVKDMYLKAPKILELSNNQIQDIFQNLYQTNLFVKLDIKSLVTSSPEILITGVDNVLSSITTISEVFKLNTKNKVISFIRSCPRFIASHNLKQKLVELDSVGLHLDYLVISPSVLDKNTTLISLKYFVLKAFDLEFDLDMVMSITTCELLARLKFLSINNHNLSNSTLSSYEFYSKFDITKNSLLIKYQVTSEELTNLHLLLYKSKEEHRHLLSKLLVMLDYNFIRSMKIALQSATNKLLEQEQICLILSILGLEKSEIITALSSISNFISPISVVSIIESLVKLGYMKEEIIELITNQPTLICSCPNLLTDDFIKS